MSPDVPSAPDASGTRADPGVGGAIPPRFRGVRPRTAERGAFTPGALALSLGIAVVVILGTALVVRRSRLEADRERAARAEASWEAHLARASAPVPALPPFGPREWGVIVSGPGSLSVVADAEAAPSPAAAARPGFARPTLRAAPDAPAERPRGTRLVFAVEDSGVRLLVHDLPLPPSDLDSALVPPRAVVADAIEGRVLPARAAARGPLIAAIVALVRADSRAADAALSRVPAEPAAKVLLALAACLRGDVAEAHRRVRDVLSDPDLGSLARFVTGATLLMDGNPVEARRDFDAALAARPDDAAAALLRAVSIDRAKISDAETAAAYAKALEIAPNHPLARLGAADSLSSTDREKALAAVVALAADFPDWPAPWMLRARLEPTEEAWAGAAAAFGRAAETSDEPAPSWFNRGAALQQAAMASPPSPDPEPFRARLREALACYAKALRTGIVARHAAVLWKNVGLALELLPGEPPPEGASDGFPTSARTAFEGALLADPAYASAKAALFALLVSEGWLDNAHKVGVPRDLDSGEQAALKAAAEWAAGHEAAAASVLSHYVPSAEFERDPLPTLARALLDYDYPRLALSLLLKEEKVPARIYVRARAHARLRDPDGVRADVALLDRLDPALARDALEGDPAIRSALGLPSGTATQRR